MDFETAAIHGIVSIRTTTILMNRLTNESCKLKIKDKGIRNIHRSGIETGFYAVF